jgi:hypothetical protein
MTAREFSKYRIRLALVEKEPFPGKLRSSGIFERIWPLFIRETARTMRISGGRRGREKSDLTGTI